MDVNQRKAEPMMVIYDMFDAFMLQLVQQKRSSKRKRIPTSTMEIDPKRQKYVVHGTENLKGRCVK